MSYQQAPKDVINDAARLKGVKVRRRGALRTTESVQHDLGDSGCATVTKVGVPRLSGQVVQKFVGFGADRATDLHELYNLQPPLPTLEFRYK